MSPLEGLVVVDAGNLIAGPMAADLLGDYGASVIKLEHHSGDPLRDWEPPGELVAYAVHLRPDNTPVAVFRLWEVTSGESEAKAVLERAIQYTNATK